MKCFLCQTKIVRGRIHKAYQSRDISCEIHQSYAKPQAKTSKEGSRSNDRLFAYMKVVGQGL